MLKFLGGSSGKKKKTSRRGTDDEVSDVDSFSPGGHPGSIQSSTPVSGGEVTPASVDARTAPSATTPTGTPGAPRPAISTTPPVIASTPVPSPAASPVPAPTPSSAAIPAPTQASAPPSATPPPLSTSKPPASSSEPAKKQLSQSMDETHVVDEQDDMESDDESIGAETGISGANEEKKKKKKNRFGLKVPKAIKTMSGSTKSGKHEGDVASAASVSRRVSTVDSTGKQSDLAALMAHNERLRASLDETAQYLEARTFTISKLEKARDDDQMRFNEEIAKLELEMDKLRRELAEAKQQALLSQKDLATLEETLKAKESIEQSLGQSRDDAAYIESLQRECSERASQNADLRCEVDSLNKSVARFTADVDALQRRNEELEISQAAAQKKAAAMAVSHSDLESENRRLSATLVTEREQAARFQQEKQQLADELEAVLSEKRELEAERSHLQQLSQQSFRRPEDDEEISVLKQDVSRLQQDCETAYVDLRKTHQQNEELLRMIGELRSVNQDLEEKVSSSMKEQNQLHDHISQLKADVANARAAEADQQLLDQLTAEKSDLNAEISSLFARITDSEGQLADIVSERDELRRKFDNVSSQLQAMKVSLDQRAQESGTDLSDEVARLEADKAGLVSDLASAQAAKVQAERARQALADELAAVKQKFDAMSSQASQLKDRAETVERQLRQKTEAAGLLEEELSHLSQRETQTTRSLEEAKAKLREIEEGRNDAQLELIRLRAEWETNLTVLEQRNQEIERLRQEKEVVGFQLTQLRVQGDDASAELGRVQAASKKREAELSGKVRSLQADLDSATERIRSSVAEVETARADAMATRKEVYALQEELNQGIGERAQFSKKSAELGKEVRNLQNQLASKEQELRQAETMAQGLQRQLDSFKSQLEGTETTARAHAEALRVELTNAEGEVGALRLELQGVRQEMSRTESQLKSAQIERDVLKSASQSLKEQIKSLSESSALASAATPDKELALQREVLELKSAAELQELQLKAATDKEERRRQELERKAKDLETLQASSASERIKTKALLGELELRIADLEQQNQELRTSASAFAPDSFRAESAWRQEPSSHNRKPDGDLAVSGAVKARLDAALELLRTENSELKCAIDLARSREAELEAYSTQRITRLSQQVAELEEELRSAKIASGGPFPSFGSTLDGPIGGQTPHEERLKEISGTLLGNVIVSGPAIPSRVALLEADSESVSVHTSVVCLLKSRLLECLFDSSRPGEPVLPNSLYGRTIPKPGKSSNDRPVVARVLSRVQKLWELAEDLRLGLVQADVALTSNYLESKTAASDWTDTLDSLRGSAQILERRNRKLEELCNSYLYATKEARAAAHLEREKCKSLNATFKKRLQQVADGRDAAMREKSELLNELEKLRKGLDIAIDENKQLQEGQTKYLTTIPQVKGAVDGLKAEISRLSNTPAPGFSASMPRTGLFDPSILHELTPRGATTTGHIRMSAPNFSAPLALSSYPRDLSPNRNAPRDKPTIPPSLQTQDLLSTTTLPTSYFRETTHGVPYGALRHQTPLSMRAPSALRGTVINSRTEINPRFSDANRIMTDVLPKRHSLTPEGSSSFIRPLSTTALGSPTLSFGTTTRPGRFGSVPVAETGATRSISPLRVSPLLA